jgi:hypothetical protein
LGLQELVRRVLDPRGADYSTGLKVELIEELEGTPEGWILVHEVKAAEVDLKKIGR